MDTPTFDQIDGAFRGLDAAKYQTAMKQLTAQGAVQPTSVIGQVCPIYKAVRPFLQAVANLPLIPQAWRNGITAFISAMDLLCP
jgi:hypothetical protein